MRRIACLMSVLGIVLLAAATVSSESEEFNWRGRLASGQTIEIKGVNGDIQAEEGGDEVEVRALKTGRRSDPSEVRIEVMEHSDGVTICAVYPSSGRPNECRPGKGGRNSVRNNDVKVHFSVRVPAGVAFMGRTVNGDVEANQLASNASAHTVNGKIEISCDGSGEANTVNGSIYASLGTPFESDAEFSTVNGTGKTSILCQILAGRLGPGYRPVFLDMQGIIADHDGEFLALLRQECERSLGRTASGSSEEKTGSSPYSAFTEFLQRTARSLGADRLLLLVDEYELIDERIRAGRLSSEIPRFFNSLLQHIPRLSLILTGSSGLEGRPLWNDLLGKSFYREVSFLDKADAEALIREPLDGKVSLQGNILARLLRLSASHPYFTQLLGQNLVDWLNENREALVTPGRIDRVVARILEHPPPHLVYMWEEHPLERRLVLASLASLISTPVEFVSWRRVSRVLSSVADGRIRKIGETRTRILLEDLRQRRLVDRDQQRYRFKMDLIRIWVAAEHSVWSVLSDL